jgi:hypothetical protein
MGRVPGTAPVDDAQVWAGLRRHLEDGRVPALEKGIDGPDSPPPALACDPAPSAARDASKLTGR